MRDGVAQEQAVNAARQIHRDKKEYAGQKARRPKDGETLAIGDEVEQRRDGDDDVEINPDAMEVADEGIEIARQDIDGEDLQYAEHSRDDARGDEPSLDGIRRLSESPMAMKAFTPTFCRP